MQSFEALNEIWQAVYSSLGSVFSQSTVELWFKDIKLIFLSNDIALLTIEKAFKKEFIENKYIEVLKDSFCSVLGFDVEPILLTGIKVHSYEEAEQLYIKYRAEKEEKDLIEKQQNLNDAIKVISPDKKATSYYTFENFITGDSNKFAYAACYAIAHSDEVNYNPLFIHGKSGLGKTHLCYAVINYLLQKDPSLKVVYIKGEEFTTHLVDAIKNNSTDQFRKKYRTADILLVDDIQFIAGKASSQEEFFHTFNALYESQKQIIVTCDRQIREMKNLEERIKTRLEWGLPVDITPPDTELRMAIIRKKAEELKLSLDEEIVEFIAKKLKDNVRLIEGGIKKLAAMRFIMNKEITLDLAKTEISHIVPQDEPKSAKVEKVILAVCDKYNISKETITGKRRTSNIALARHVCMCILHEALDMTYTDIGKVFSCDHSTVMSAKNKIASVKENNPEFAEEFKLLLKDVKDSIS